MKSEQVEYEYAIATDEWMERELTSYQWGTLDEAQTELARINHPEVWGALPKRHQLDYRIVKRRKAGRIEEL